MKARFAIAVAALLAATPSLAAPPASAPATPPAAAPASVPISWTGAHDPGHTHDCASYYPDEARRQSLSGKVYVTFDVAADGAIGNLRIAKSSGSDLLDKAVLTCIAEKWRETPATTIIGTTFATTGLQAVIRMPGGPLVTAQDFYEQGMDALFFGNDLFAIGAFSRAIALKPDFTEAYRQRAMAYDRGNNHEHALADYAKAGIAPPATPDPALAPTH